jgi:hypothetical protein
MSIRHKKVPVGPDIPGYEILFSDWKDDHVGANLTVTDGTTTVADVTQETLVGATVAAGGAGEAIVTVGTPDLASVLASGRTTGIGAASIIGDESLGISPYLYLGATGEIAIESGGEDGGGARAVVRATAQIGAANAKVQIRTDGSLGSAGDLLTADGANNATWQPPSADIPTADEKSALDGAPTALTALNPVASIADLPHDVQAANVPPVPVPAAATAESNAFVINAILAAFKASGEMAPDYRYWPMLALSSAP